MTTQRPRIFYTATLLVVLAVHFLTLPARAVGSWMPLKNLAPANITAMLLLSDGTVMALQGNSFISGTTNVWFRLTPDIHGSYANGTWSTDIPAMHDSREAFGSDVLQDGRVLVAGGEYGSGWSTSEVYDPVTNIWTRVPVPTNLLNPALFSAEYTSRSQGFVDSISTTLPDGRVLIAPAAGNHYGQTMLFAPQSNTWSAGGTTIWQDYAQQGEASWLKLPDGSILTVDGSSSTAERYLPTSDTWTPEPSVPVPVFDPYAGEIGPALLLPNGKGIFFGGTSHTVIYTPSGGTSPGSWVAGPDFPNGQGMPDAPAAMMVNGKILLDTSPTPTPNNSAPTPTSFYEYDYQAGPGGAFTQISAPDGGVTINAISQIFNMLALPDGTVLVTYNHTNQLYVYQPDGSPLSAGKPVIATIVTNSDGSLHLTGTRFNGISTGAAYGDDSQMDSNYPLVRFTDASGNVRYGRTYNWSTSAVQTGNAVVSTECTVPAGASLHNTIQVVANGIASDGVRLANFPIVTTVNDNGPGSLRQAVAAIGSGGVITFAANLSGQTITLTGGQMVLTNQVTIDGTALAKGIALNGYASSRIFTVAGTASVVLSSLTLTNGYQAGDDLGGAVNNNGTLTLNNCVLAGNSVDGSGAGGAIENVGQLTLNGCTLAANRGAYAGAINNRASCTLNDCTFSGNSATNGNGGAIDNAASISLNILHCTFSGNSTLGGGGAIDNYLSPLNITNTVITGNSSDDIYNWSGSTISFGGANIVQQLQNDGTLQGGSSVSTANPQLAPLGNYGGPTPTMPLLPGSPAIDAGSDAAAAGLATDQRGYARQSGAHVDIGAVEFQTAVVVTLPATGMTLNSGTLNGTVNPGDETATNYFQYGLTTSYGSVTATVLLPVTNFTYTAASALSGLATGTLYHFRLVSANASGTQTGADLTLQTYRATSVVMNTSDAGAGSLREAIANTLPGGSISFAAGLSGATIGLTGGQITISNKVTLDASALANGISISGNSLSGIFHILYGTTVVMNALTLTNGYNGRSGTSGYGGAINNGGTLTLSNCTLAGNSVAPSNLGGAIDNNDAAQLTLTGCTLYDNSGDYGGAIQNRDTSVCILRNTTLYGNTAIAAWGGAIFNSYNASLFILQSTICSNSAPNGGSGIFNLFSALNFTNSIIAGNDGDDIGNYSSSTLSAGGSNIVQVLDGAGTTLGTGTIIAANPLLLPPGNYGGPTLTLPPQSGSPAVNAGVNSAAAGLLTDQRGQPRLTGGAVDIGAVELLPSVFTSAAPGQGLDLQGVFPYAVNLGGNGAPGQVGNANFTADTVSGVTITTPGNTANIFDNWASPNFGATTNGLHLAQVMSSIRWTYAPSSLTVNLSGLQAGASYRLQLLFIESLDDRVFNVTVNGATIVPNFRLLDYGPLGTSIVIPYVFTAPSTNALIQLGGGAGGTDNNPAMSGFTLEALTPPATVTPSVISRVTRAGTNLIFGITNGVPGGGWTLLTTTNLAAPVRWTTNGTGTFDGQGSVTVTNGILSAESTRYFILRAP